MPEPTESKAKSQKSRASVSAQHIVEFNDAEFTRDSRRGNLLAGKKKGRHFGGLN
jgi:hypothetical protein